MNKGTYILGIISGLILYKLLSLLFIQIGMIDFDPLLPYLRTIDYWCVKLTTKNIAELGIILLLVIPLSIFILKERKRKI